MRHRVVLTVNFEHKTEAQNLTHECTVFDYDFEHVFAFWFLKDLTKKYFPEYCRWQLNWSKRSKTVSNKETYNFCSGFSSAMPSISVYPY